MLASRSVYAYDAYRIKIGSKRRTRRREDGGGDITCIGKNRLLLTFHYRSFPFLDKEKKKEEKKNKKSLFVKILSACQGS